MTDVRISTSAEVPIHSDGAVSTVTGVEGDTMGMDSNGDLIAADAATGTAEPCVGVLATPVDDHSSYSGTEVGKKIREANRADINEEKVGFVRYGVILENQDADWTFTPGDKVYLAEGGGFTQTAPSDAGDLVQVLGVAVAAEEVFLDIQTDYTTV